MPPDMNRNKKYIAFYYYDFKRDRKFIYQYSLVEHLENAHVNVIKLYIGLTGILMAFQNKCNNKDYY